MRLASPQLRSNLATSVAPLPLSSSDVFRHPLAPHQTGCFSYPPQPRPTPLTAVGEPPLCMACNVVFAVKGAIGAALAEINKPDYFIASGPLTPEHIQGLCRVDSAQFVL